MSSSCPLQQAHTHTQTHRHCTYALIHMHFHVTSWLIFYAWPRCHICHPALCFRRAQDGTQRRCCSSCRPPEEDWSGSQRFRQTICAPAVSWVSRGWTFLRSALRLTFGRLATGLTGSPQFPTAALLFPRHFAWVDRLWLHTEIPANKGNKGIENANSHT